MPYRGEEIYQGGYYHVFNRGAGKNLIFFNDGNYEYCLRLVERYQKSHRVEVLAYCLMPNHYHFLVRQDGDIPISKFIKDLFITYVQAVNRQQNRRGTLFEGRFRHVRIEQDHHLQHLCRYIHLNPVEAELVAAPGDWAFSDYKEWITEKGNNKKLYFRNDLFGSPEEYQEFVDDWQAHRQELAGLSSLLLD